MSKRTRELFEQLKNGEEPSMGFIEAAKEGIREVRDGFFPGLNLADIVKDIGAEMKRMGVQGQMEVANALFNGSSFVPYGPGQWSKADREGAPEHGLPHEAQKEQERGGMEM